MIRDFTQRCRVSQKSSARDGTVAKEISRRKETLQAFSRACFFFFSRNTRRAQEALVVLLCERRSWMSWCAVVVNHFFGLLPPPALSVPTRRSLFHRIRLSVQAKTTAEVAAVFAAGGPAPITGAPPRLHPAHRAQLPGLDEVRAAALIVYAFTLLEEAGDAKLAAVGAIAENARLYDSNRFAAGVDRWVRSRCVVLVGLRCCAWQPFLRGFDFSFKVLPWCGVGVSLCVPFSEIRASGGFWSLEDISFLFLCFWLPFRSAIFWNQKVLLLYRGRWKAFIGLGAWFITTTN